MLSALKEQLDSVPEAAVEALNRANRSDHKAFVLFEGGRGGAGNHAVKAKYY